MASQIHCDTSRTQLPLPTHICHICQRVSQSGQLPIKYSSHLCGVFLEEHIVHSVVPMHLHTPTTTTAMIQICEYNCMSHISLYESCYKPSGAPTRQEWGSAEGGIRAGSSAMRRCMSGIGSVSAAAYCLVHVLSCRAMYPLAVRLGSLGSTRLP